MGKIILKMLFSEWICMIRKNFVLVCSIGYYANGDVCTQCAEDASQTTMAIGAVSIDECGM